jgi:hypothetical protein
VENADHPVFGRFSPSVDLWAIPPQVATWACVTNKTRFMLFMVSLGCSKRKNSGIGQQADNYTKRKNKIMNIEIIANEIKTKIAEGAKMLESLPLRMEINDVLRRNNRDDRLLKMNAGELMVEFTKALICVSRYPRELAFQTVEERLKPLTDIATILNSEELNESVHIRDNPCVLKDSRMLWEEFKKKLWQQLFGP